MEYLNILIAAALVNNYIVVRLIGVTPFIGAPKNISSSFFMGLSVTLILLISSIITYPLFILIILPLRLFHLDLLFYGVIILIVVRLFFYIVELYLPFIKNTIGIYFPVISFNSVLFGVSFSLTEYWNKEIFNFPSYMVYAVGCGLGYLFALILMSLLRKTLPENKIPVYLKGAPLTLICAGIISLMFQLFRGAVALI